MRARWREHVVCSLLACSLLSLAACSSERAQEQEASDVPAPVMRAGALGQAEGSWITPDWSRSDRWLTQAERSGLEAAQAPFAPTPAALTSKELALHAAAKFPPSQRIRLAVALPDVSFDYTTLKGMGQAARASMLSQRRAAIGPAQASFEAKAAALGGADFERFTLGNHVVLTIEAGQLSSLAALPEVISMSLDSQAAEETAWNGANLRFGSHTDRLINTGFTGGHGHRTLNTAQVKLAIAEVPTLRQGQLNRLGWWHAGLYGRVLNMRDCTVSPCTEVSEPLLAGHSHATEVASVAVGSIENGSDFYGNPGEQAVRSFQTKATANPATATGLQHFIIDSCVAVKRALESAVWELETDIFNMSFSLTSWADQVSTCQSATTYDCTELNYTLRTAAASGILLVGSAGNIPDGSDNQSGTGCQLVYPTFRPEVLSVGGLDTEDCSPPLCNPGYTAPTDYKQLVTHLHSARGNVPIRTAYSMDTTRAGVDVMAPFCLVNMYNLNTDLTSGYAGQQCGTSYSAPAVAGAAALLRDHVYSTFAQGIDSRALFANMLMLTDGYWFYPGGPPSSTNSAGANAWSGLGRFVGRVALTNNSWGFTDPNWSWGWGSFTLSNGQVHTGTLSSPFTQFRWAATWFGEQTAASAHIMAKAYKNCAGTRTQITADLSPDLRKKFQVRGTDVPSGCTFEMDVIGYNIPAGETRQIWEAWQWHNEPPGEWARYPTGCATAIASGGGSLWVIGCTGSPDRGIYKLQGSSWVQYPGAAVTVAVSNQGVPWVINSAGSIFKWNGSVWEQKPGSATSIAVGNNDDAYIVRSGAAQNRPIAKWNGSQFVDLPGGGGGVQVAVASLDGSVYMRNSYNNPFWHNGSSWVWMPGAGTPLGSSGPQLTIDGTGGAQILYWNGSTWVKLLPGSGPNGPFVGFTGNTNAGGTPDGFWAIDSTGAIYTASQITL